MRIENKAEEIELDSLLKETTEKNKIANRVINNGEIHFFVYNTNYMDYKNIAKLIVNLYKGFVNIDGLEVLNVYDFLNGNFGNLDVFISNVDGLYDLPLRDIYAEIMYNDVFYRMKFKNYYDQYNDRNDLFYIECTYNKDAQVELKLCDILLTQAYMKIASFKDAIVMLNEKRTNDGPIKINLMKNMDNVDLNDIFLPENVRNEIDKFIYCFNNYKNIGISLKYLFSGDPGVGKTEVMRAIINKCKGNGNISIVKSVSDFSSIFEFVSSFELSLLCIDDIDLLLGNRADYTDSRGLQGFLDALDGVMKNNVFIISTTNDKKLVDVAATRPGRFSSIIDFTNIEEKFYMKLVNKVTDDEEVLGYITDSVLDRFSRNKVSGSFIVNFVKNLKVLKSCRENISEKDIVDYFDMSYSGFYRKTDNGNRIGFRNED